MLQNDRLIDETIKAILDYDAEPPDECYSPVEFAKSFARRFSIDEVRDLACAALARLPSSTAVSILEGLLSSEPEAMTADMLYQQIGDGRQVDTSGAIVDLLVGSYGVSPDDVAAELMRRLEQESVPEKQDRLAFGVWVLFNRETFLVAECKCVGYLVSPINHVLEQQIQRSDLSNYSVETLRDCRR